MMMSRKAYHRTHTGTPGLNKGCYLDQLIMKVGTP